MKPAHALLDHGISSLRQAPKYSGRSGGRLIEAASGRYWPSPAEGGLWRRRPGAVCRGFLHWRLTDGAPGPCALMARSSVFLCPTAIAEIEARSVAGPGRVKTPRRASSGQVDPILPGDGALGCHRNAVGTSRLSETGRCGWPWRTPLDGHECSRDAVAPPHPASAASNGLAPKRFSTRFRL